MPGITPSATSSLSPSNIAQWVMSETENTLSNAVNGPMQALFQALMPVIVVGLTLQFVVYAFALMHGQSNMTVTEFFRKAILVAVVSMIFGVGGLYQKNIADTMIALPDDVAQLALGTSDVAVEVDKLQNETSKASSAMMGKGQDAWYNFLPSTKEVLVSILATLVRANAAIVGSIIIVMIVVCKVGMALVVATGPIFIAATLFEPTKPLLNSWISQALNFVLLALLAGLIFGLMLQMNIELIRMIADQINGGAKDILSLYGAQLLVGIASLIVMIMIPGLAAGLSNGFGAQLGIGATAKGVFSIMRLRSMMRPRAK
ncbi:type IV secretion system protein [Alcaligenes faecalis]|nr:type IV secretion system protein [Alcaligenes faecalis]